MSGGGVRNILIVGADVVAWMAAAALSKVLRPERYRVQILRPEGCAGRFSESTDSQFSRWLALAGIALPQFLESGACIHLGTRQRGPGAGDSGYVHAFGPLGARLEGVAFHHHWLRLRQRGTAEPDIQRYSMSSQAAIAGRFAWPADDPRSMRSLLSHGFCFETERFIRLLRAVAEARGVVVHSGSIARVRLDPDSGAIRALDLAGGATLDAEFFIDCTPAPQRLMQGALQGEVEDWSRWLPCDRALVRQTRGADSPALLQETSVAREAWQWELQGRSHGERGYAWCSDDRDAAATAAAVLGSDAGASPGGSTARATRTLSLQRGRPRHFWLKNCVALTAGSIAPIDAVRLHLAHTGIARLLALFPSDVVSPHDAAEYNRQTGAEHDRVRDLMILHQWRAPAHAACDAEAGGAPLPDSLRALLELFIATGRLATADDDFVSMHRWLSVLLGQGAVPRRYDPIADTVDAATAEASLARLAAEIAGEVAKLPEHGEFLRGAA